MRMAQATATAFTLPAQVSAQEALVCFKAGIFGSVFRSLSYGPLRSLSQVYLPFLVHEIDITLNGKTFRRVLGMEGTSGVMDLYGFDETPFAQAIALERTRNHFPPALEERQAQSLLLDRLRRMLFRRGFFRVLDLAFHISSPAETVYIPYWVGLYGRKRAVRIRVLDAVRGQIEGAKARQTVLQGLAG